MDFHYVQYNRFFYSNLCHVCKKAERNIKRCSICKSVAYCSKDHQKHDWKSHKMLCKAIAEAEKMLSNEGIKYFNNLKNIKVMTSALLRNKLGRKLDNFEEQICMFPRVCIVCFSKNVFADCENCLNVSYCSEEHRNMYKQQHSKYCDDLRLCMEIDLYYFYRKPRPIEINVKQFDEGVKMLPSNLEQLMIMYGGNNPLSTLDEKIQFIIKCDCVAPAATILYGLEKSQLVQNRIFSKQTLTVHIVGADMTEMSWLWKLIIELCCHWIKNLSVLDYFVIGPEIYYDGITSKFEDQLCNNCKERKVVTNIIFHSKLYHEVISILRKPDIVVAFNSGLHEFHSDLEKDNWRDSISCLIKHPNVPLVLTAYTLDEIKQDVDIVRNNSEKSVRTILEPQRNPFSNLRPIRDWETENIPVFYLNGYIAILSAVT